MIRKLLLLKMCSSNLQPPNFLDPKSVFDVFDLGQGFKCDIIFFSIALTRSFANGKRVFDL